MSLFEFRLDISFKLYRKKTRSEQSAGIAMEATRFQLVICYVRMDGKMSV